MRGRAGAAVAVLAVLTACSGGGGGGRAGGPTSTSSTAAPAAPSTTSASPTSTATTTGATAVTDPAGAVTLHATALVLPDTRAGGGGLRVVVHPASGGLVVRRPGTGAGDVRACPVADAGAAVSPPACVALDAGRAVELPTRGVEIRAAGGDVAVDELTVAWAPADRAMALVTPARPAGACAARACEASFSVTPPRPGPFTLDGHPAGGRPRLILVSNTPSTGSIRTLATVEGGGSLSIRATLQAGEQATLTYSEQGPAAIAALPADISWP